MSQTSRKVLGLLTQDYLWIRNLENQKESNLTDKLNTAAKEFQVAASMSESAAAPAAVASAPAARSGRGRGAGGPEGESARPAIKMSARTKEWDKAVTNLADTASEQLAETTLQKTKKHIFS